MSIFPCEKPITANISIASGMVDVTAEDRDSAEVTITPLGRDKRSIETAETTKVDFRDGRLIIQAPEGVTGWILGRGAGAIRVDVRIPSNSDITIKTATAEIDLDGTFESVSATTASGEINIDHTTELSVNSASGDVSIESCCSGKANTVSGDLEIKHITNDISVKSVSGDIRIDRVEGAINGSSVSGDVWIGRASAGSHRLKSMSGSVSVGIASGTSLWMDLNSVSGTTSSDLAVGDIPVGDGSNMELRINTVSGNIELFRA